MTHATFSYEGMHIRATVQREQDMEWLREFLLPWYEITHGAADVQVLVTCDPVYFRQILALGPLGGRVNAFMMDTQLIDLPRWNAPAGQLAFYDDIGKFFFLVTDNDIQIVANEAGGDLRISLMRVLRELATGIAQLRGGRFLHASAFVTRGRAAIIAGPRQAGKTSLLSYVLLHSDAKFLSNDRILVSSHGKSNKLRGMPTIVSIRDGTLNLFPKMRESIQHRCLNVRLTMAEARERDTIANMPSKEGCLGLSPQQFCSLLDCQPEREALGSVLLFPRQTGCPGGLELRSMDTIEVRQRLQHCLLGHIRPDLLSDTFTTIPSRLKTAAAPDDNTFFSQLAGSLSAYDCELGNDAYSSGKGAEILLQLLEKSELSEQPEAMNTACSR